jgi:muramoyltetrapeptide carboxypeptidase
MQPLRAPALRPGDVISVVAPAGPPDRARVERGLAALEQRGFRLRTYGPLFAGRGYLAADDEERLRQLNAALRDPETAAVFPARGGYGCARLLAGLDYQALARRPKIVVGFSDLTALHAAIDARLGLVTFHSPNLQDGLGAEAGLSDLADKWFWRAVLAEAYRRDDAGTGYAVELDGPAADRLRTLVPGVARGRLCGGNLAVFAGLAGSPYLPDLAGRILVVEDVGEAPYRIDRFLAQLRLSGALERIAGALLGQFTDCEPNAGSPSLNVEETLHDYFGRLSVPVLAGFPLGHTRAHVTLPLGAPVEVDATGRRLRVLEDPVATNC